MKSKEYIDVGVVLINKAWYNINKNKCWEKFYLCVSK